MLQTTMGVDYYSSFGESSAFLSYFSNNIPFELVSKLTVKSDDKWIIDNDPGGGKETCPRDAERPPRRTDQGWGPNVQGLRHTDLRRHAFKAQLYSWKTTGILNHYISPLVLYAVEELETMPCQLVFNIEPKS